MKPGHEKTPGSRSTPIGQGLARFMELRGRRITEASGALWHGVEGRFLMCLPYHLLLEGQDEEISRMLRQTKAAGARYLSRSMPGLGSGLYVRRDRNYSISSVDTRQRSRVRRGLERCEIRTVDPGQLLTEGLQLNTGTMQRQGRFDAEFGDPRQWRRLVEAVSRVPEVSAVGAFVDGRLAAYMILAREDGWLHILHQMSRLDLLDHNPNHALTFTITKQAVDDAGIEAVCYGALSLVQTDGLHEYKQRLGYEFHPCATVIQLHPVLVPVLANRFSVHCAAALRKLRPADQRLERIHSVLDGAFSSRSGEPRDLPAPGESALVKRTA